MAGFTAPPADRTLAKRTSNRIDRHQFAIRLARKPAVDNRHWRYRQRWCLLVLPATMLPARRASIAESFTRFCATPAPRKDPPASRRIAGEMAKKKRNPEGLR